MNLYLIERTDETGYDEYDAHVIAAESADEALARANFWAALKSPPTCQLIGVAAEDIQDGIVLSSFNAG